MIRTRFAPSPTGLLHLGNARAALFSALYAAKSNGIFLLRIEDTDLARSEDKYINTLLDDLHWLGIEWQEGPDTGGEHAPYRQSERHHLYDNYYQQLEKIGLAYPCFCSDQELAFNRKIQLSRGQPPRYPGICRKLSKEDIEKKLAEGKKPALRFQVLAGSVIEFVDLIKGPQKFASDDIGDFVIRRAESTSTFMFCNAIDDSLMEVSHVIRGEDHLANTPRQLMILQALNLHTPQYGHLSLITGEDGTPLSKRHGSFSLHDLRQQGYLSLAVLNYLARLSHTYEQQQLMNFSELAQFFSFAKLSRAPARFDLNQLQHWQKEAVMTANNATISEWLENTSIPDIKKDIFIDVVRQNMLFPNEAKKWADILFCDQLSISADNMTILKESGETFFVAVRDAIHQHGIQLKLVLDELKNILAVSGKKLFMPLRIALTGEQHGPELVQIANLLGKEKMLQRIDDILNILKK
jgi:glutamyl-tRNA synthetase